MRDVQHLDSERAQLGGHRPNSSSAIAEPGNQAHLIRAFGCERGRERFLEGVLSPQHGDVPSLIDPAPLFFALKCLGASDDSDLGFFPALLAGEQHRFGNLTADAGGQPGGNFASGAMPANSV